MPPSGVWGSRLGGRRTLIAAVAVFLAARLLMLAAIVIAAAVHHVPGTATGADLGASVGAALGKSDGVWYLGIAHHGYGSPPPIGPDGSYVRLTSLAFFPLYPLLVRLVAVTGLPYLGAALLVTALAGIAAAAVIAEWARPLAGDRGAVLLVAAWSVLPSSVVLDLAYSEALFVVAAAGCLLALQRRRWLTAGIAASVGGLTRPTGGGLVLAVALGVALQVRRERHTSWRPVVAALLAPVGLVVSLVHVAVATGRLDGWFWLENTVWRSGFDGGSSALAHFRQLVTGGRTAHRLPEIVAAVAVVGFVVLAVMALRRRRLDSPTLVYSLAAGVLAVGERAYFYVKPRLLFVCFPLLLPLARWLARLSRPKLASLAAPAVIASIAYNAYLVVVWPKAL